MGLVYCATDHQGGLEGEVIESKRMFMKRRINYSQEPGTRYEQV